MAVPINTDLPLLRASDFDDARVRHGFTTRHGGVSTGCVASLTLARGPDTSDDELMENWRRAAKALGAAVERVAIVNQVHGDRVVTVDEPGGPVAPVANADAAITTVPGIVLGVRVADCLPVIFAAPGGVGVAHAGWRGAAAGIAEKTARALAEAVGCGLCDVRAVLGPCISAASYETGPDVVEALVASGVPSAVAGPSGTWTRAHADIRAAVAWQLGQAGVSVSHVDLDTATRDDLFSYRRDAGRTGRQAGLVVLRA